MRRAINIWKKIAYTYEADATYAKELFACIGTGVVFCGLAGIMVSAMFTSWSLTTQLICGISLLIAAVSYSLAFAASRIKSSEYLQTERIRQIKGTLDRPISSLITDATGHYENILQIGKISKKNHSLTGDVLLQAARLVKSIEEDAAILYQYKVCINASNSSTDATFSPKISDGIQRAKKRNQEMNDQIEKRLTDQCGCLSSQANILELTAMNGKSLETEQRIEEVIANSRAIIACRTQMPAVTMEGFVEKKRSPTTLNYQGNEVRRQ